MKLSERLEARAAFEDKRVLDEAKALVFVPDVYTGRQTGALLREAAELARRVEDAEVAHVEPKNGLAVLHERCVPLALMGQRVRIVPDTPTPPAPGHEREGRQSPHCTCTTDPSITCIVHPQEAPDA